MARVTSAVMNSNILKNRVHFWKALVYNNTDTDHNVRLRIWQLDKTNGELEVVSPAIFNETQLVEGRSGYEWQVPINPDETEYSIATVDTPDDLNIGPEEVLTSMWAGNGFDDAQVAFFKQPELPQIV